MRRLPALVLALAVVAAPAAAHADTDGVALSLDGRSWSSSLDGPVLTDVPATWVPGDVAHGRLWVRNDGPVASGISAGIVAGADDGLLDDLRLTAHAGDLVASVRGAGTTTGDLGILEPGEQVRLGLEVGFVASSTNRSQTESQDVRLRVVLTEAVVTDDGQLGPADEPTGGVAPVGGPGPAAAPADGVMAERPSAAGTAPLTGTPSGLPGTGAPVAALVVWAGALATGTGAAIVVARRREAR